MCIRDRSSRLPQPLEDEIKRNTERWLLAGRKVSPADVQKMVPMAFPLTYKLPDIPLVAKYPIDLWEKENRPAFSVRQWCMLCQMIAEEDMEHLSVIWELAQDEQDKLELQEESAGSEDEHEDDPDYYATEAARSRGSGITNNRDSEADSRGSEADKKFVKQMNAALDILIDKAGSAVMLKDLCKGPDTADLKAWFEAEYPEKMDTWCDAKDLYTKLRQTLDPNERGDHVYETCAAVPEEDSLDHEWNMPESADQQDKYEEASRRLVAEDRKKRIKFHNKMEAAIDDYHERTYGASSSSSKKRQAADTELQEAMDVDDWVAAEESVDFSE